MNKQCPDCGLINFSTALNCYRCQGDLSRIKAETSARRVSLRRHKFIRRLMWTPLLIVVLVFGFYVSLRATSDPLKPEQRATLERALQILAERGFTSETRMLRYVTTFRASDNWLNRSAGHENAYAAANFPFPVITLYGDFFDKPQDDTERAAILLHEAQHLYGADEPQAYEYVWRKRHQLGWTQETYQATRVWNNVREATQLLAPQVFQCGLEQNQDCTE